MTNQQLIFVYNADSGLFSSVADFAHKIISPSTYQCSLCNLTYGNFSMKQKWKDFIETLPAKPVFLYKDQFLEQYGAVYELPAVFSVADGNLKQLISRLEISNCHTLQQLKDAISRKLAAA